MKTVVIGDIHGGFRALKQLLENTKFPTETQYIFVGDYVDGWSESAEVVSYLIDFSKKMIAFSFVEITTNCFINF